MSEDVFGSRGPLHLYSRKPNIFDVIFRRRIQTLGIYAAYLIFIAISVIGFESLPPKYEVSAMIDLHPEGYIPSDEQPFRGARADEMARSQIALLTTESVIRGALADAAQVLSPPGKQKDVPATKPADTSDDDLVALTRPDARRQATANMYQASTPLVGNMLAAVYDTVWPSLPAADEAYKLAKRAINSQAEPNTGFIRISFRDYDPAYAVRFLNALIKRFTDKHYELYSNVAAVSFFTGHRKESEDEFSRASAELAVFSAANNVFDIEEQRKLLLQERSRVMSDFAATRDLRVQKESEVTSIADQLVELKPFSRYPQVNSLAQSSRRLHSTSNEANAAEAKPPQTGAAAIKLSDMTGDPPLLLVKVYQDTITTMVKLNTDIAGLRAKLTHEQSEIDDLDRKLADLSVMEGAFGKLRQKVELAKATAAQFGKKAIDEQIRQDLNTHKLSTVRVVQPPLPPIEPIWPRRTVVLIALVLAALPPIAFAGPAAYRRLGRLGRG
jgi:uncharacterized protein involved in exopolysaccharide biosynthesis